MLAIALAIKHITKGINSSTPRESVALNMQMKMQPQWSAEVYQFYPSLS